METSRGAATWIFGRDRRAFGSRSPFGCFFWTAGVVLSKDEERRARCSLGARYASACSRGDVGAATGGASTHAAGRLRTTTPRATAAVHARMVDATAASGPASVIVATSRGRPPITLISRPRPSTETSASASGASASAQPRANARRLAAELSVRAPADRTRREATFVFDRFCSVGVVVSKAVATDRTDGLRCRSVAPPSSANPTLTSQRGVASADGTKSRADVGSSGGAARARSSLAVASALRAFSSADVSSTRAAARSSGAAARRAASKRASASRRSSSLRAARVFRAASISLTFFAVASARAFFGSSSAAHAAASSAYLRRGAGGLFS